MAKHVRLTESYPKPTPGPRTVGLQLQGIAHRSNRLLFAKRRISTAQARPERALDHRALQVLMVPSG